MVTLIQKATPAMPPVFTHCQVAVEYISVDAARGLVEATEAAGANFRKSSPAWIAELVRLRRTGGCDPSPLPIVIDEDGYVQDGMHRLKADIAADSGRWYLVVRRWPKAFDAGIDNNRVRRIQEWVNHHHPDWSMTAWKVATIRVAILGTHLVKEFGRIDPRAVETAYSACRGAFDMVFDTTSDTNRSTPAGTKAAMVRAVASRQSPSVAGDVQIAAQILATGVRKDSDPEPRDRSIHLLARYLLMGRKLQGSSGQALSYQKTSSAIDAFIRGVALQKIYGSSRELFPVPALDNIRKSYE